MRSMDPPAPRRATAALTLLLCLLPGPTLAGQEENPWAVDPADVEAALQATLFQDTAPIPFTLTADFETILDEDRDPNEEPEDREATLTLLRADGSEILIDLVLNTRGNWRLNRRNCRFPPLWLDFDKDDEALVGTVFEGQNRLKLYLPCRPGDDRYERYIEREYLVYPVFNLFTDVSFQARLAEVTFVDSSGEEDTFTTPAFLLEHKDDMAARNRAVAFDPEQLHPRHVAQTEAALVEMFNFMIGMTDWSSVFMHNIQLVRKESGDVIPVPYDFDWSGMVNTRYARPDSSLGIRTVRQRIYQGFCRGGVDYESLWALFGEKKEAVYAVYRDATFLDEDSRKDALEYLDDFYEIAEDPEDRGRVIQRCRAMP